MIKYFLSLPGVILFSCTYHDLPPDPISEPVCDVSSVSWQNDILPIMTNSCSTGGCHDGISRRDWRNYDEVMQYAAAIKKRTQDKSMPFDGPLPRSDIDKIACWVDNGAVKN